VAVVLGKPISADEFRSRYAAYLSATSSRDNILLRKKILGNMVNEALIFDEIHRTGMDADSAALARMAQVRDEALLMGYARRITLDTMAVTTQELRDEFRRYKTKVRARYLYAKSEDDAWRLRERIDSGATFDVLAREVFEDPGLANNGGDLGYFGWGEMEPALEDAAFSMSVGEVSDPVKMRIGYSVIKVEGRTEEPLLSENDYVEAKEKLEQSVKRRKVLHLLSNATSEIGRGLSIAFDETTLGSLFSRWRADSGIAGKLLPAERGGPPDTLAAKVLMKFGGSAWTAGDFMRRLSQTSAGARKRVNTIEDLRTVATGLATREVLLERAHSSGLESDSDVVRQVKRVGDEYFLKRWSASVQDTVGRSGWKESEMMGYFREHRELYAYPPEVNVAEILVRTEKEARGLVKLLRGGADFAQLARKRSIRLWAAKKGGELGFGTRSSFGLLGDKFFKAKEGDLIGPEHVEPYYGVFKILGAREGRSMTFDEARDEISKSLAFLRKQQVVKEAVDRLRAQSAVEIHENVLADVVIQ
jgi:parvulin-like peptidyl-prolyl isomerase